MRAIAGLIGALALIAPAFAAPPPPAAGSDAETKDERKARRKAEREARAKRPDRLEWLVVPELSYDTDIGVGTGILGQWAKLDPDLDPYKWRLSAQAFFAFKGNGKGGLLVSLQHHYLILDLPGLADGRLRLNLSFRFRRESTHGYFGLGNGSVAQDPWRDIDRNADPDAYAAARRFHQVDRIYPVLYIKPRLQLTEATSLFGTLGGMFNRYNVYEGSLLDRHLEGGDGELISRLGGLDPHGQIFGGLGFVADTRDDEIAPESGHLIEGSVRWGKGLGAPFSFGGVDVNARAYVPVVRDRVTIATRVVFDGLFGDPPMYELVRAGGLVPIREATGGALSFRGIRAHRYYGKVKLIGNLEARFQFFTVRILNRPLRVGAIAFVDTGRVWADWRGTQRFDATPGNPAGLKIGGGGGLRLRLGETIMVRIDGAVSPDGWGAYVDIDHIF